MSSEHIYSQALFVPQENASSLNKHSATGNGDWAPRKVTITFTHKQGGLMLSHVRKKQEH